MSDELNRVLGLVIKLNFGSSYIWLYLWGWGVAVINSSRTSTLYRAALEAVSDNVKSVGQSQVAISPVAESPSSLMKSWFLNTLHSRIKH